MRRSLICISQMAHQSLGNGVIRENAHLREVVFPLGGGRAVFSRKRGL